MAGPSFAHGMSGFVASMFTSVLASTASKASATAAARSKSVIQASASQFLYVGPLSMGNVDCESGSADAGVYNHTVYAPVSMFRLAHPALAVGMFSFGYRNVRNLNVDISLCESESDGIGVEIISTSSEAGLADSDSDSRSGVRTSVPFGVANVDADVEIDSPCSSSAASSLTSEDESNQDSDEKSSEAPSSGSLSSSSLFSECLYCSNSDTDSISSSSVYSQAVSPSSGTWIDPYANAPHWASHPNSIDGRPAPAFLYQSGVDMLTDYPVSTSPRMTAGSIFRALREWCSWGNPSSRGCHKTVGHTITYDRGSYASHWNLRNHRMVGAAAQFQAFSWDSSGQPRMALARETEADHGVVSPRAGSFDRPVPTEEFGGWTGQHVGVQDLVGEIC